MIELDLLFPKTPPAALAPRHGMPDCLRVTTVRSEQGSERCAAAIYGAHAYVIHYAFTPDEGSKAG